MARCMLYVQGLGHEFWPEAVSNVVYTCNRCPNKALVDITPEEAWSGKRPCISHMYVCMFVLLMLRYQMRRGPSLMPRASNACSLAIVKAPRPIGLFALRVKRSSKALML